MTVTDGTGSIGILDLNWVVNMGLSMSAQQTTAGQTVALPINAIDNPSQQLAYTAVSLPPGLSINGSQITGWPTGPGTYTASVEVTDPDGIANLGSFTWTATAAADSGPNGPVRLNLGGKCLDDTGNSTTSGTGIQLWNCNGDAAQKWTMTVSLSPLGIEFQHGSLCVSPTSMTAANGAQLVLGTCGTEEGNWHAW